MKTTTQARGRRDGQFTFEGNFDRLCKCGRTLGVHSAEKPHAFEDAVLDDRDLPDCDKFRPAKVTA